MAMAAGSIELSMFFIFVTLYFLIRHHYCNLFPFLSHRMGDMEIQMLPGLFIDLYFHRFWNALRTPCKATIPYLFL